MIPLRYETSKISIELAIDKHVGLPVAFPGPFTKYVEEYKLEIMMTTERHLSILRGIGTAKHLQGKRMGWFHRTDTLKAT